MNKSAPDFKSIFAHAFELDSADDRERYLASACDGDAAVRGQVEGLLKAFDGAGDFARKPRLFVADPRRVS